MDPLRKPRIEYTTDRGRSVVVPKRYQITAAYRLTASRVAELCDELITDIDKAGAAVDSILSKVAISIPEGPLRTIADDFSRVGYSPDQITYSAYLTALSETGSSAEAIRDIYRDWNLTQWGDASVVAADILRSMKLQAENIKSMVEERPGMSEDTLAALASVIGKMGIVTAQCGNVAAKQVNANGVMGEISLYNDDEKSKIQALIADRFDKLIPELDRARASVAMTNDVYWGQSFPSVVLSSSSNAQVMTKGSGVLSSVISELNSKSGSLKSKSISELEDSGERFVIASVNAIDIVEEVRTLQSVNKTLSEAGGVSSASISDVSTVEPTTNADAAYTDRPLSVTNVSTVRLVRKLINDEKIEVDVSGFVANEEFEALKDAVFFDDTVKIDGGAIQAGTVESGAMKIGDRPIILSIIWGENQQSSGASSALVNKHLSHSDGDLVVQVGDEVVVYTILASEVLLEDGATAPTSVGKYWIYASLGESGYATIIASPYDDSADHNRPDGTNVIRLGMWTVNSVDGSLMTSYGTTIINGNHIITGTVVANFVKVTNGTMTGDELVGVANAKPTVTYGDDPPTVPVPKKYDIWIDTTDGKNLTKVYTGTDWVSQVDIFYPGETTINGGLLRTGTVVADLIHVGGRVTEPTELIQNIPSASWFNPIGLTVTVPIKVQLDSRRREVESFDEQIKKHWAYSQVGQTATDYETSCATFLAQLDPICADLIVDSTLDQTAVDAFNLSALNYYEKVALLTNALSEFFRNSTNSVLIDADGIKIGSSSQQAPNSVLTSTALTFNYGSSPRVQVGEAGTLLNDSVLRGSTTVESNISLPDDITIAGSLKIEGMSDGFKINFL